MQDRDERYKEFVTHTGLSNSCGLLQIIQQYESSLEERNKHNISEEKTMSENLCDSCLQEFKPISEIKDGQ